MIPEDRRLTREESAMVYNINIQIAQLQGRLNLLLDSIAVRYGIKPEEIRLQAEFSIHASTKSEEIVE